MSDVESNLIDSFEGSHLNGWDIAVIIVYFIFVLTVGIWSSRRSKSDTVAGYFLASRNMHWIPVGASLFASNIGSGHFIGLAGSGAASGISVAGFELFAVFVLMMLGWLFVPVYMSSGIYTMPEYLKERFGGQRIRVYLSFLALLLYIFTKISADLYAGALFIQLALNKNSDEWLYISILILLGIAALFTIAGGLTAVIWTDFVQTILMIVGSFILMGISFSKIGGYQKLVEEYPYAMAKIRAGNGSCGVPRKDYMNLLRSPYPGESDLPWTGMVFGLTINSMWYWCTDQVIVQRTLASKNMSHAKGGCILAAYLKLLPLWLLILPGMAARILYPDRVGCADPAECIRICGSPGGCSNIAYAELVIKLLPSGLSGLMLAVMMAALMSSLTSIFNSASTIFTIDVWTRFRAKPSDVELLLVGRLFVIVLVVISVIWIPVIQSTGTSQLFDYIQSISAFLAPPICAVYLLAIFWGRTNEPGAFWGLMSGLVIGMTRFIVQFSFIPPPCGSDIPDNRIELVKMLIDDIHYLHFSCFLFLISGAITISISLITRPIPEQCLRRLTFWTRHDSLIRESIENRKINGNIEPMTVAEPTAAAAQESSVTKFLQKICCVSSPSNENSEAAKENQVSEEEKAKMAADFLYEDPKAELFVNFNALLVMCCAVFVIGFFA